MADSLQIKKATFNDRDQVEVLWRAVLNHAFNQGPSDDYHNAEHELAFKMEQYDAAFNDGKTQYFLAFVKDALIGTIAYGSPPNRGIMKRTDHALKDMVEIGSLYVEPSVQKKGYGTRLLLYVLNHLLNQKVQEVCFDSIIETSKKIWTKMFGEPTYKVPSKKHNFVHMIWVVDIAESIARIQSMQVDRT